MLPLSVRLAGKSTFIPGGQHGFEAITRIRQLYAEENRVFEPWMCEFECLDLPFNLTVQERRRLAGEHNKKQHAGSVTTFPEYAATLLRTLDEDVECLYSLQDILRASFREAGYTAAIGETVCGVAVSRRGAL